MQNEIEPQNQNEPSTASQIFTAIVANFTGIASGIAMGFSAILIPSSDTNSGNLNYDQLSWIASVIFITTMFGCCVGGIISDAWGRRYCLQIGNGICLFGWILIVIAYYCLPPYQFLVLLIGRLITGFSMGTANVTTLVYTAETSTLKFRPIFTTWCGIFNTIGIFLIYMLGYIFKNNWGIVSMFGAAFPFISFISIAFCLPESPAWLDSQNNKAKVAKPQKYQYIDIEEVTTLLVKEETVPSNIETIPLRKRLLQRTCLIPISIIISYFFFLNFSGFFVIIAYASNFVLLLKIPLDPFLTICSFAAVRLIGAIFLSTFSENMGRRFASIISGIVMTLTIVCIVIYLQSISTIPEEDLNALFWLPIGLIWIYIFACTVGFGTIPFAMTGEIFPLNIRGVASGISICLNSFFTFLAIKVYPSSLQVFGTCELLLLYGLTSFIGTIFLIAFLPETKGKTLKEIEDYFANCKSLRNFRVLQ